MHPGSSAGTAARVQGLRRYLALLPDVGDQARLVKVRDDARFADGGIGLVIAEGALSTDQVKVEQLRENAIPIAAESERASA